VRIASPLLEGRLVRGFEGPDVGDALRCGWWRWTPEQGFIDFERLLRGARVRGPCRQQVERRRFIQRERVHQPGPQQRGLQGHGAAVGVPDQVHGLRLRQQQLVHVAGFVRQRHGLAVRPGRFVAVAEQRRREQDGVVVDQRPVGLPLARAARAGVERHDRRGAEGREGLAGVGHVALLVEWSTELRARW
jgi:hypothetical protein